MRLALRKGALFSPRIRSTQTRKASASAMVAQKQTPRAMFMGESKRMGYHSAGSAKRELSNIKNLHNFFELPASADCPYRIRKARRIKKRPQKAGGTFTLKSCLSSKHYLARFKWYHLSLLQHPRRIIHLCSHYIALRRKCQGFSRFFAPLRLFFGRRYAIISPARICAGSIFLWNSFTPISTA